MTNVPSKGKPKFSVDVFVERFDTMKVWAEEASDFARALDWLGDATLHPEGSEKRELALVRDQVDFEFNRCCRRLVSFWRVRAETTHCEDLLIDVLGQRMGNGPDALHLMQRCHHLFGDESNGGGTPLPETFPDSFAWDTYLRVSALTELADKFPKHPAWRALYARLADDRFPPFG